MSFSCLMYHSLSDGQFPDTSYLKYTTTRRQFREHLERLLDGGVHLGSFQDFFRSHNRGEPLPVRTCLLTFDDGHKSSLEMAAVMKSLGLAGTFFLTKDYCESRGDFLKASEIRDLADAGFDLGTHGVSHRSLAHMPRLQMESELRDSKDWLENILGKPVIGMSLPAGQGNREVYEAAYRSGYLFVGNSREFMNDIATAPAPVNRFVILAQHDAAMVQRIALGSLSYIFQRWLRAALLYWPKRVLRSYNTIRAPIGAG